VSRRADFLLAVQAFLLRREEATDLICDVLEEAFALPEHALPARTARAGLDFVRHKAMPGGYPKPAWLAEHEDSEAVPRVVVSVVLENSDEWWQNAEQLADASAVPPSILPLITDERCTSVTVPKADADALMDWATTVPGWSYDAPPFVVAE